MFGNRIPTESTRLVPVATRPGKATDFDGQEQVDFRLEIARSSSGSRRIPAAGFVVALGMMLVVSQVSLAQFGHGSTQATPGAWNRQPAQPGTPNRLPTMAREGTPRNPVIELQPNVVLNGPIVRLSDVAMFRNMTETEAARLRDVTLAPLPSDRALIIEPSMIRSRLQACGYRPEMFAIQGAARSVAVSEANGAVSRDSMIQHASVTVDSQRSLQIQGLVRAVFDRQFQASAVEAPAVDLRVQIHPSDMILFEQISPEAVTITTPTLTMGGPQAIEVAIRRPGGVVSTVQMAGWLEPRKQNFVLKYAVPRGHIVQPQDLERIPAGPQGGLEKLGDIVGKETLRALKAGAALQAADLTSVALIKPNDIVTVTARSGGISVRRQFKSNSAGAMDETVTLVALDDPRERVVARVTGLHEAIIENTISNSARPMSGVSVSAAVPANSNWGGAR